MDDEKAVFVFELSIERLDGASEVDPSSPVRHADDDDPWAGF